MRFDTEPIRREVDHYKDAPSAEARRRMEKAFGALDQRVRGLETLAQTQSGVERMATEQQIADLKHRRDLHWVRAQTVAVENQPVKRAEPVAERVTKVERANNSQRARRAERVRGQDSQRMSRGQSSAPVNFFQRLFR